MTTFYDRVKETTTTTGTGNITLAGAVTGFVSFNTAVGLNTLFDYMIEAVDANDLPTGDWEVGVGYLSNSTTLVRSIVRTSTNSDNMGYALVNFAAGTKNACIVFPATQCRAANRAFKMQFGSDLR
jgi:hypothetical protein